MRTTKMAEEINVLIQRRITEGQEQGTLYPGGSGQQIGRWRNAWRFTDKSMIAFLESWTRTAFVAAIMVGVIPVITCAQTTDTRGEDASTPTGRTPPPPVSDTAAASGRFYFVTGVVFDWSKETRFQDKNCSSTSPAALYGCGKGPDGAPFGARGDFGTMAGFDLGFGYAMTPALRMEAVMEYHPRFSFKGLSNFVQTTDRQDVSADLSSLHGLLAAYWDLTEVGLPRLGPLRPFIGGGGGLSRVNIDETLMEFPKTTTVVPGGEQVNFAWMLAAGVAKSPGERVTLNLAWRYTDSGTVETRWSSTLPKPERICRIMDFEYLCTTCSEADM